jgi:hypothetical protein
MVLSCLTPKTPKVFQKYADKSIIRRLRMQVGDTVKAFGDEFEILEVGPREAFVKYGLEPQGVALLGIGIIGLNKKTNTKEYFYDFDCD